MEGEGESPFARREIISGEPRLKSLLHYAPATCYIEELTGKDVDPPQLALVAHRCSD